MEIVIYITISILILAIALIKQRMLANIETSNPYHAQYILRRRDDYLVLFDRDALSCRFFYDAFPGMRLRHQVTAWHTAPQTGCIQGKIIRSSLFVLNNSHFMFKN